MKLFVNILSLDQPAKVYLQSQLPPEIEVFFRNEYSEQTQKEAFQKANLLFGNPPLAWFEKSSALRWWQLESAGFDGYKNLHINCPVTNMGDYFAWPCAETIVAGILAHYRKIDELAVLQTQKKWVGVPIRFQTGLLRHKKVVVLGAGEIGKAVKKMLLGFDCDVQLMARTAPEATIKSVENLKATLPYTDLVINCLPGTAQGFFSAELINLMQKSSIFANVGRGNTVDETALIAALQNGHLGGAILDVTATEPLPINSPFWEMKNVVLTQHTGGGQPNEDVGKIDWFLANFKRFQTRQPLRNQVDLAKGY